MDVLLTRQKNQKRPLLSFFIRKERKGQEIKKPLKDTEARESIIAGLGNDFILVGVIVRLGIPSKDEFKAVIE